MMNNKVHIGDSSPAAQQAWGDSISTYREDRTLPTCRLNYITNHPTTQLANLHADESMIAPAWCKISKSVWWVTYRFTCEGVRVFVLHATFYYILQGE